jgi:hypothetical protein
MYMVWRRKYEQEHSQTFVKYILHIKEEMEKIVAINIIESYKNTPL